MAHNVLGTELEVCCSDPVTGYYRNGKCDTDANDQGMHTVCALMTEDFLSYSREVGNDLSTPHPELDFPGLVAGDQWCLCMARWVQAHQAGRAPRIFLKATHASVLEFVSMEVLHEYAADVEG